MSIKPLILNEVDSPTLELATIDKDFGGWVKAQPTHIGDGGIFDQIYKPSN